MECNKIFEQSFIFTPFKDYCIKQVIPDSRVSQVISQVESNSWWPNATCDFASNKWCQTTCLRKTLKNLFQAHMQPDLSEYIIAKKGE